MWGCAQSDCADIRLHLTPTGSRVTWSMDGNHNFIGKAVGMFIDMDKMFGTDVEKGLALLKAVVESKQVALAAAAQATVDKAAAG